MVKDYVAFDLETTGLNCERDEIIEIGALKVKDGKVTERFARLIKPKLSVPPEITAITGITNEMLESAPPVEKVIPEFVLFCRDEILLGHNVMFDYKFTKVYAKRYGLPFEKKGLDTLKIARKVLPELESRSLGALCEHYEIVNQAATGHIMMHWRRRKFIICWHIFTKKNIRRCLSRKVLCIIKKRCRLRRQSKKPT